MHLNAKMLLPSVALGLVEEVNLLKKLNQSKNFLVVRIFKEHYIPNFHRKNRNQAAAPTCGLVK